MLVSEQMGHHKTETPLECTGIVKKVYKFK